MQAGIRLIKPCKDTSGHYLSTDFTDSETSDKVTAKAFADIVVTDTLKLQRVLSSWEYLHPFYRVTRTLNSTIWIFMNDLTWIHYILPLTRYEICFSLIEFPVSDNICLAVGVL